jgi:hypothetical protein
MKEKKASLGLLGMGFGSLALLLAIAHFWAGPFSTAPKPSLEQTVAEKAAALKRAAVAALKGEKSSQAPARNRSNLNIDKIADISAAILAGLAIVLGVFGYATHEPMRAAVGAAVLGSGALAFQFAVVALGAIILVILIVGVLSVMGGS